MKHKAQTRRIERCSNAGHTIIRPGGFRVRCASLIYILLSHTHTHSNAHARERFTHISQGTQDADHFPIPMSTCFRCSQNPNLLPPLLEFLSTQIQNGAAEIETGGGGEISARGFGDLVKHIQRGTRKRERARARGQHRCSVGQVVLSAGPRPQTRTRRQRSQGSESKNKRKGLLALTEPLSV